MIGRGVRPVYEGRYDLNTKEGRLLSIENSNKKDCMVLDFGNVIQELGPIDAVNIEKDYEPQEKGEGEGEAVIKLCPACLHECAPACRVCPNCDYQFLNIEKKAAKNQALLTSDEPPKWLDVMQVFYSKHSKQNGVPSLKVSYSTMGEGIISEWICFEHHKYGPEDSKSFAWDKACQWHRLRNPQDKPPTTIEAAIDMKYKKPTKIKVKRDGKYWRVLDYDFTQIVEQSVIDELEDFDIPF